MTHDKGDHRGSIFFALPDGSGLLYQLVGQAGPPLPIANISKSIPCKQPYPIKTEPHQFFPVKSWKQRNRLEKTVPIRLFLNVLWNCGKSGWGVVVKIERNGKNRAVLKFQHFAKANY